jgi:hypothetical protein
MGLFIFQQVTVGGNGNSAKEDARLDVGHVLLEAVELVADLIGKLACVTQNQGGVLTRMNDD